MRDNAFVVGQYVACPACDDGLLARIADGRRRITVCLAGIVVGRGDARSEERHRRGGRTDSRGGVSAELLHVRPPFEGLLLAHHVRAGGWEAAGDSTGTYCE